MALYAAIMAGGVGSRFWPRSRQACPKQFLEVFGAESLIQNTFARLQPLVDPEHCLVVTHERYVEQTREDLPAIPEQNILAEPISRNTAPCIAFAAAHLLARDPDAMMIVLPADHVIRNARRFHDALRVAIEKAKEPGALVTIGIEPTHPETGYGYIQYDSTPAGDGEPQLRAFPVRTFAEKPDLATAERFLDSGDFLWNSGMFIWRADSILQQMERHLPEVHAAFEGIAAGNVGQDEAAAILDAYQHSPRISIDYGVMERAQNVYVVPGSFDWSDVGDWRAVYEMSSKDKAGNASEGNVIVHNTSRCYVRADSRLVVLVGMREVVVVDTEDAVLVCHLDATQQVKNIVDYLGSHGLNEYL
jgi:mannose-1-phosphate guanylyltransferase